MNELPLALLSPSKEEESYPIVGIHSDRVETEVGRDLADTSASFVHKFNEFQEGYGLGDTHLTGEDFFLFQQNLIGQGP